MALKDNTEYWRISLQHPESIGEEFYRHDEIIVENDSYLAAAARLRELIIAYCALKEIEVNSDALDRVVASIDEVLRNTKNIQYTEFVAYWKCLDMTFSVYEAIQEDTQRHRLLVDALNEYCLRRRKLYDRLGYSHTVQQALYDNSRSRSQGVSGVRKLQAILHEATGQEIAEVSSVEEFQATPTCQFIPQSAKKNQKGSFAELMRSLKAKYPFGKGRQGKTPDLIIKLKGIVFVIEAKHIKESGGSQDKQLNELIAYISQREPQHSSVRYVAFLDGVYFNLMAVAAKGTNPHKQRTDIESALTQNPRNYFVNTRGLRELLSDAYRENAAQASQAE